MEIWKEKACIRGKLGDDQAVKAPGKTEENSVDSHVRCSQEVV